MEIISTFNAFICTINYLNVRTERAQKKLMEALKIMEDSKEQFASCCSTFQTIH